jgi:putative membrane protein
MKWMGACLAFALAMAPALLRAEDKGTTKTSGQDRVTSDKQPMSAAMPMTEKDAQKNTAATRSSDETMTDARFVALMHHANQDEIDAGKLAEKKGKSQSVKSFGKTLVSDHTKADHDLLSAAKKAGISPGDSALTTKDKEEMKVDKNKMEQVKRMSGAEFDKAFGQVMSRGHEHVLSMVRDAKDQLKSQDLKQFAERAIPVLERHKEMADDVMRQGSQASAAKNQGRASANLERRTTDTSSANRAGRNPEGSRGDDSARSGAQNPERSGAQNPHK